MVICLDPSMNVCGMVTSSRCTSLAWSATTTKLYQLRSRYWGEKHTKTQLGFHCSDISLFYPLCGQSLRPQKQEEMNSGHHMVASGGVMVSKLD